MAIVRMIRTATNSSSSPWYRRYCRYFNTANKKDKRYFIKINEEYRLDLF